MDIIVIIGLAIVSIYCFASAVAEIFSSIRAKIRRKKIKYSEYGEE